MNQIKKKTEKLKFFYQKGIKHRKNKEHEEHSYQFQQHDSPTRPDTMKTRTQTCFESCNDQ